MQLLLLQPVQLVYHPYSLFVNTNNTVFAIGRQNNRIQIWHENDITPRKTLAGNLIDPHNIFVTANEEIYVDNNNLNNQVERWNLSTNTSDIAWSPVGGGGGNVLVCLLI